MLEVTPLAAEVLAAALVAARRFDPAAGLRAVAAADGVSVELASSPDPGDAVVLGEGYTLWAPSDLEGVLDVGEHNRFLLRPPGSVERTVR